MEKLLFKGYDLTRCSASVLSHLCNKMELYPCYDDSNLRKVYFIFFIDSTCVSTYRVVSRHYAYKLLGSKKH